MEIWLCDLTYDQQVIAADTMPLGIASIASYVNLHTNGKHVFKLFKYPGSVVRAIETARLPDVVGFSNFIWNSRLAYKFAQTIRSRNGKTVIVFGGLHYPSEKEKQLAWLLEHPVVDFYVYKEGEVGFLSLVNILDESGLDIEQAKTHDIPGVHFTRRTGAGHITSAANRVSDLASIPSPYLSGMLDDFFDGRLMPVITTNRGCPFKCAFCSEGARYYSLVNKSSAARIVQEIEYIGRKMAALPRGSSRRDVYISDSNFGMYQEDVEVAHALAAAKKTFGWPEYIQASTGKNKKERVLEVARILDGGLRLSGSVQSLDRDVLENIRRSNIRVEDLLDTAIRAGEVGANSYSEVILALPGDSMRAHLSSLAEVINAGYDFVLPWQLVMLPDSEISTRDYRERFRMGTKYRVLTKSYGNYPFSDGSQISEAEIEEVCVSGINLSYDDYVYCRQFHLAIVTFYNDRFFSGFLTLLDRFGAQRFAWLTRVFELARSDEFVAPVFHDFAKDTRSELWDSCNDLESFISNTENVKKLVDGEIGANLLAKYRLILISEHISAICRLASSATMELLRNLSSDEMLCSLISDLEQFEIARREKLFETKHPPKRLTVRFDIIKLLSSSPLPSIGDYRFPRPRDVCFSRSDDVNDALERNFKVFGRTGAAIYKQMTRIPFQMLYRQAQYTD